MASDYYGILQIRITAAILCFSILPLLAVGLVIHYQYDTAYDNKIMETAKTLAADRRSAVELFLMDHIAQLRTLADSLSSEQSRDREHLHHLFEAMHAHSPYLIDIGVMDREGKYLSYVGPHDEEMKPVSYGGSEWFHTVMVSHVYVSDIFRGIGEIPQIMIAVTSSDHTQKWVLRATFDSKVLTSMVRQGQISKKGDAFIVNRQNILQTEPRSSGTILHDSDTPDLSALVGTNVEKVDFKGNETLFGTSEMANPKWIVVIREDAREELGPLYMARHMVILTLIAGSLIIFIGALYTGRAITEKLVHVEEKRAISDDIAVHSGKMAALGKLAAGVAHEINNPVAIIGAKAGWIEDLLNKEDLDNNPNLAECADCVKNIERQIERCRAVTHRMLGFARRMEPTQDSTDINWLLSETISFLENEAHHRQITIEQQYDKKLQRIVTDAAQLQQVFLNIIGNAIDAVGKVGTIIVRTRYSSSANELVVEFEDNGPGIPKNILEKIFDPFFTTKAVKAGTGLGLSISYSIIERLGGRVSVTSEEGKGTTFKICLPME
ncbi:MAG: ATP-binding protein [Desulfomonilaceae bacterium]